RRACEEDLARRLHPLDACLRERARDERRLDRRARDERHTEAGLDGCAYRLLQAELEAHVEVAKPDAYRAELVLDRFAHARSVLHEDERLLAQLVERDRAAREAMLRRAREHDLVAEQRFERDRTVASCEADDAELDVSVGDELDDAL